MIRMNKSLSLVSFLVSVLYIGLSLYVALITRHTDVLLSSTILLITVLFIGFRFLFLFFPQPFKKVLLFVLTVYCGYETFYGFFQLLGWKGSNNYLFALTGSFENPGPFGGFLAICISILGTYALKNPPKNSNSSRPIISYWLLLIVVLSSITLLPATQSRTAILALSFCAVCFVITTKTEVTIKIKKSIKKNSLWIIIVATCLLSFMYFIKKPSADGRIFMEKMSVLSICKNGCKGAGPGHFGGAYGETQARYFQTQILDGSEDDLDWSVINEKDRLTADCPVHAFNEYLTIGVEYGPIVMLLFLMLLSFAITVSFKTDEVWSYGLIAFAVFAFFSYPLHVKQFQIIIPILLAACVSNNTTTYKYAERIGLVLSLLFILCNLKMMMPEIRQYKQSFASWQELKQWYEKEYYEFVVEDGDSLLPFLKNDQYFLFAYGQSLNKVGRYEESISILKLGTTISSNPMFWIIIGNNCLSLGRAQEAEKYYKHSFYMVPNRLYPLTLLAKLYYKENKMDDFYDAVEKVKKFIPKVESISTESLRKEIMELH